MENADALTTQQIAREASQRQSALGKRAKAASEGTLGPVIKRWINAAVGPVAERIRLASDAYLLRDYPRFGSILDSPLFGLADAYRNGSPEALEPILGWCRKGTSPGRTPGALEGGTTYADDLILAALGTIIQLLAQGGLGRGGSPTFHGVTYCLNAAGNAARETALGQFLTQVQGAEAMLKLRRWDRSGWAQKDKLTAVASMMLGQVKPQLDSEDRGEVDLQSVGHRKVMRVMTQVRGDLLERRISLRPPEPGDWKLLEVARQPKGEGDPYKPAWASFALMILCAAQVEHGWFDIAKVVANGRRTKGRKNVLVLSQEAHRHLGRDLERWLDIGFTKEPMIVPPEAGDYLTVKHRPCTGRNGPMGMRTDPAGSIAWKTACEVMAGTPWCVAEGTLGYLKESEDGKALAAKACPDEDARALILGQYSREAGHKEIYFPIYMDFRGRVYTQTTWVTYQGSDLQKGLLIFPMAPEIKPTISRTLHLTNLYGNGLDKASIGEREDWVERVAKLRDPMNWVAKAEEPIQLLTALSMADTDAIPCQIDGTCNGLQHLTALFRDHVAAPFVNLTSSSYEDHPADLYGQVADIACDRIMLGSRLSCTPRESPEVRGPWAPGPIPDNAWLARLVAANVKIDRKLCKKPVMVLPYGGTRDAVEQAVTAAVLDQKPDEIHWKAPLGDAMMTYAAFADRDLSEHPLFHQDMRKLSGVIWDSIVETIPKAMQAMDAFRAIAKGVGERSLEWRTGPLEDDLWVVHAYPKSDRTNVKFRGFHLPNSIRSLTMRVGRDEIDPQMHRTGIVANFIHSQDAHHLARTMDHFQNVLQGASFGAIHDCFLTRPSQIKSLNYSTRASFRMQYEADPLSHPVRLRDMEGKVENFPSWYFLADIMGAKFPGRGEWEPREVLDSAWFFS